MTTTVIRKPLIGFNRHGVERDTGLDVFEIVRPGGVNLQAALIARHPGAKLMFHRPEGLAPADKEAVVAFYKEQTGEWPDHVEAPEVIDEDWEEGEDDDA